MSKIPNRGSLAKVRSYRGQKERSCRKAVTDAFGDKERTGREAVRRWRDINRLGKSHRNLTISSSGTEARRKKKSEQKLITGGRSKGEEAGQRGQNTPTTIGIQGYVILF